jgi:hypothetical protein
MDYNSIEYQWFATYKYNLLVLSLYKKYKFTSYKNINVIMIWDYLVVLLSRIQAS